MPKKVLFLIRQTFLLLFLISFSLCLNTIVFGQDDSDSELPPDLQKKVNEAKARKDIAEARKAELEAAFPIPDADSLRTSTEFKEIKGEFIETRLQGYKAMSNVASKIACRSRGHLGQDATLVIYRPEEAAMIQNYLSAMDKQMQLLQWYEELIKDAEQQEQTFQELKKFDTLGGAFPPILGVLGDLAKLFQRKESYTPTLFDISDREIISVFFDQFKNAECPTHVAKTGSPRLFYPGLVPISLNSFNLGKSDLWTKVVTLESKRRIAESKIQPMFTLGNQLKTNLNPAIDSKRLNQFASEIEELKFRMETLREFYKGFLKEIGVPLKEEDKTGDTKPKTDPPITTQTTTVTVNVYNKEEEKKKAGGGGGDFFSYLQAEKLYKLMNDPAHKGYWIQMSVSKAGGNVRVISIPIVDIFTGSRVRFSGGAIVTYNIFNLSGDTELSGIIPAYEEYTSSKKIKESLK